MATQRTAPGVYIVEQQQSPMITGVGTSTAGFVGWAANQQYVNESKLITNFTEFTQAYSEVTTQDSKQVTTTFTSKSCLAYSVYSFFQRGGTQCYIVNINGAAQQNNPPAKSLPAVTFPAKGAGQLIFTAKKAGSGNITVEVSAPSNTGPGLFNVKVTGASKSPVTYQNVGISKGQLPPDSNSTTNGLTVTEFHNDDVTLAVVGSTKEVTPSAYGSQIIENSTPLPHKDTGSKSDDTFSNPDMDSSLLIGDETKGTGLHAFDVIEDVNLILIPDLCLLAQDKQASAYSQVVNYCTQRGDCFFIGDIPAQSSGYQDAINFVKGNDSKPPAPTLLNELGFAAFYYPWIQVNNPEVAYPAKPPLYIPPSGAVAGAFAATDASRGVFKSAAGTTDGKLPSALQEQVKVTQTQLGLLNQNCVNDIRTLTGKGVCIWGAVTNAGEASEWKYIAVRRLFIYVEQSIRQSSAWIVFEPNTPKLWGTITRNITVFLTSLWQEGALFGATAQDAFFIKVDEENNPPEERRKGNLTIEIGLAPVFPAEFIIIKIGQKVLPAE
ncbi:phage tail sheath family protein [Celerinatantimonas diazotrophica]|uniref:Tail sheath protein C-terminal domain-containing protein n=1 Tax=Celerinatantimonas diazotrophica TaxID=412034 RepID=A0A4R1J9T0_9GAMM|nr:phage tail sheath C-terminal domain-containing protein [Celerinatantimonas diazotrophica]TCK47362.1 hypothetical protein EV690_2384 [Celerinatantimonas diazotrophica]CAG9295020.1 hypothetical protein CEDIAZO_00126 [Celerinatantimonas diazotrophica]